MTPAAVSFAALCVLAGGSAASAAVPAGTGEPIAALNAISADGTIAVGADSISTFLTPLCGTGLAERRTAAGWAAQRTPSPPTCGWLASVATLSRHRAWAVGYQVTRTAAVRTLTEFYNGSRWQIEPSPNPGSGNQLHGVAVTKSGTVWAVGADSKGALILKRSGSHWVQVPAPFQAELQGITVTPSGQVWAVGSDVDQVTFGTDTAILHLTTSGWQQVPSPSPGGDQFSDLTAVAAGPHGALWAVGNYIDPTTFDPKTLTVRYVAGHWTQVASPTPGSDGDWLYAAAVTSSGQVWAVGGFSGPKCERNLVEHFTGGTWHLVSVPNRGNCPQDTNAFYGVTVASGKVYAVGQADIDTLAEVAGGSGHWQIIQSSN